MEGLEIHEESMRYAIEAALEGIRKGHGGPFGACIVDAQGVRIATAYNTVIQEHDPTCHAEVNAIRLACQHRGTHSLEGCTIYTTAEPCPMCLGAILWARMSALYIGVERQCAAHYGFDDRVFYDEIKTSLDQRSFPTQVGILSEECMNLFKSWVEIEGSLY